MHETLRDLLADPITDALVAADGAITGAMIALVPSAADVERLAIPGGEDPDDLHLTLIYLGEAAEHDNADRARLAAWAAAVTSNWESVVGEAFGVAELNPRDEPCLVMICGGAELAEFHETVVADVADMLDVVAEQHEPWLPHITLQYVGAPGGGEVVTVESLGGLTGPVNFDRLRLAFAGEVIDVPFGPAVVSPDPEAVPQSESGDAAVVDEAEPSSEATIAASGRVSAYDLAQGWG